jgi:hypothetical protein
MLYGAFGKGDMHGPRMGYLSFCGRYEGTLQKQVAMKLPKTNPAFA